MQEALFEPSVQHLPGRSWHREMLDALNVSAGSAWTDRFGLALRKWLEEQNHQPIKTLSLFSGGGGLDIAFHDAGFDIIQMVEIEERYVETLRANSLPGKLLEGAKVEHIDIRAYEPDKELKIEFIIGGPPCQTFSAAGRRAAGVLGTDDPRGNLFKEYVRLLKTLQPKGFLFENVYGITGAQDGAAWKKIQNELKEAGYTIHYRVLDAADFGVPQHRERLFIVGLKEGSYFFPFPTHGPDSIGEEPYYTAGEAVATADRSGAAVGIQGRYGALLTNIPPGLNYSFYTEKMGHPRPVFSWRSKFSDFLYKADPNAPVRTIKAQGGQYTGPFSWENRPFTVAELKRLQTFPDEYEIVGGQQASIEQIGNSVPPQIGRILALSILNQVIGVSLPFSTNYLPDSKKLYFRQRKRSLTKLYAEKAQSAIRSLYSDDSAISSFRTTIEESESLRFLSRDFAWTEKKSPNSVGINLKQQLSNLMWEITANLESSPNNSTKYEIVVTPTRKDDWCLGEREVLLRAMNLNESVFTGLWKCFEEKLLEVYGIADLVQLSGYYQYRPKIEARMLFALDTEIDSFWWIVQQIAQGAGVGTQLCANKLANLWGINREEVLSHLKGLRRLGYEVRSHYTNKQIPIDEYLVPYIFPTFTPKSVQLRKRLDKHNEERVTP